MTTYFNIEECNKIINFSSELKQVVRDDSDRGISYTFWSIGNNYKYRWIFDRFDRYLEESQNVKVTSQIDVIHLFKYTSGNAFTRHSDIYYTGQAYNVGSNLTDDYEGGDFLLYNPDLTLEKSRGKLYSFYHTREHEVTMITSGVRWSLIGFYFYDNIDKTRPLL